MKKTLYFNISLSFAILLLLAACGSANETPQPPETDSASLENTSTPLPTPTRENTPTPLPSPTPDPCSSENIQGAVDELHAYMREFDDASALAATVFSGNMSTEQLREEIVNLQRIRRGAEDHEIPACLSNMKIHMIAHMNSVINTLIAILSNSDQAAIDEGIAIARQQHDAYTLELTRLLGITIEAPQLPTVTATP
ncbi:MAG: hypothetical protein JXA13_04980 [Anaerolineales bacterium]|nr:hypothetical protein [Anaerolineales bacterium]